MRLIDADALLEELPVHPDGGLRTVKEECLMIRVRETVKAAPTVAEDINVIGKWISVKDRLPEEHESIFHKFLGTPMWSSAMWQQESDKVLVCVSFPDGTSVVTTGCLHNSDWMTTVSKTLPQTVTHWMPLPEPPKEANENGI